MYVLSVRNFGVRFSASDWSSKKLIWSYIVILARERGKVASEA